jgi:hypothetical protein
MLGLGGRWKNIVNDDNATGYEGIRYSLSPL